MTDLNQNARDLIEYYCSMEVAPEYALLVKGFWGCGKSHLVDEVISKMKCANSDLKFLRVSLYGIGDITDIEAKFFEQLNPIISSKKMIFAGQIAKGILKGALKIDLDGDGKTDVSANLSVPEINLAKYLTDTKHCILVFDDLERCSMDIQVILGYINYFVEKDGYKVVLIADESKLIELSNSDSQSQIKYQKIKEKLIGKTIEVKADVEGVFDHFVTNLISPANLETLAKYKAIIISTFTHSGYNNLRSLRKCFLDLELWFSKLDADIKDKEELMEHFLALFIAVSMEVHAGSLPADKVGEFFNYDYIWDDNSDGETNTESDNKKKIKDKYQINFSDSIIDISVWQGFFESNSTDLTKINAGFRASRFYALEQAPNWKKLWYFYNLDDNEFTRLQGLVVNEFNNREYNNLCELKHVAGMLLLQSQHELLNKTPDDIVNDVNDYLKDLDKESSVETGDELLEELNEFGSYQGLSYTCERHPDFQLISNMINDYAINVNKKITQAESVKLIQVMNSDPKEFLSYFEWSDSKKHYKNKPILQFINANEFLNAFLNLPNKTKHQFIAVIKDRLNRILRADDELYPEFEWFKLFKKQLEAHLTTASKSISTIILGHVIKQISESVDFTEKQLARDR
ncbi:P-loop NTPase fold protein [Shewanella sp. OMA3-2]|uniref:P-loop NTPase fold protein n=1 Tax=Shewanella sp. OMA3-2 TaxID=2908650 RepID=UPI001F4466EB|nr:P-loop NTPase fold protein [Shewanella sp. OMA3-2]UJF22788.1 KAP family NTPase [Shewanella sp. OMA3-2]